MYKFFNLKTGCGVSPQVVGNSIRVRLNHELILLNKKKPIITRPFLI